MKYRKGKSSPPLLQNKYQRTSANALNTMSPKSLNDMVKQLTKAAELAKDVADGKRRSTRSVSAFMLPPSASTRSAYTTSSPNVGVLEGEPPSSATTAKVAGKQKMKFPSSEKRKRQEEASTPNVLARGGIKVYLDATSTSTSSAVPASATKLTGAPFYIA